MAIAEPTLFTRADGCGYGWYRDGNYCRRSGWSYWGRWVLAGVCILLFILILSCLALRSFTARRRRRRGVQPFYGTGWMAGGNNKPWGNQNNHQMYNYNNQGGGYNPDYPQQHGYGAPPPPPAYQQQPQYTGTTFNPQDGYYGQQHSGVQPPQGTYQRDEPYSPPAGPPPGKA
ncbi:hypothetical protein FALBO_10082 [Fusarium albosuccineum]|uniref:Uncharacterized protein n=1 Tax=Fusarium albosuccineum TaxID=1237068 RepID=A0A8H4L534_9HYPO|nr:hypothetical protein FALBO_10082 [Fusarium albosuccineum]KAF4986117.1 hypothetical protein FDECE_16116 [Fusarium decemcellulare]